MFSHILESGSGWELFSSSSYNEAKCVCMFVYLFNIDFYKIGTGYLISYGTGAAPQN